MSGALLTLPENSAHTPTKQKKQDRSRPRISPPPAADPHLLAAALFLAYATLGVLRYRRMETLSWDLGIFEQVVRAYAHLQAPVADLKAPGTDVLGDHFSPVTALLAPAYRLFPTPVTLLVAQSALFALAAIPVTRAWPGCSGAGAGSPSGSRSGFRGGSSGPPTSTSTRSASPSR